MTFNELRGDFFHNFSGVHFIVDSSFMSLSSYQRIEMKEHKTVLPAVSLMFAGGRPACKISGPPNALQKMNCGRSVRRIRHWWPIELVCAMACAQQCFK
jgi:hypothetical protein